MSAGRITGLVLAGGQGSRLGGLDKGLVVWRGRPLIAHVIERFSPQVDGLLISANRNRERYAEFGQPVLADRIEGYAGPLAGLQAGLAACPTPLLAMVPCDAPRLPLDLVARLDEALSAESAAAAVAASEGKFQPTFLLCRRKLAPNLDTWLAAGGRKMADWLRAVGAVAVPFADTGAFVNFNRPEDLA
jgi:molybdenum cofactor guanylyltransferase